MRAAKIRKALIEICDGDCTVKSEYIVHFVKISIGDEYIFGDTILRELRRLREKGLINYDCPVKQDRLYRFKKIEK